MAWTHHGLVLNTAQLCLYNSLASGQMNDAWTVCLFSATMVSNTFYYNESKIRLQGETSNNTNSITGSSNKEWLYFQTTSIFLFTVRKTVWRDFWLDVYIVNSTYIYFIIMQHWFFHICTGDTVGLRVQFTSLENLSKSQIEDLVIIQVSTSMLILKNTHTPKYINAQLYLHIFHFYLNVFTFYFMTMPFWRYTM